MNPEQFPLPNVSIVIPTLNEAQNIVLVLQKMPEWVYEVILVDGHSNDGTVEIAQAIYPKIIVLMQEGEGKGGALRQGFAAATGDIIVTLDADGSTNPVELPAFIGALMSGADYVKGSRFLQGGGTSDMELYRRLGNWGFVIITRWLFGGNFSDLCYGYNAFWRNTLQRLALNSTGFEIETEMNLRALSNGLKVVEVPSFEHRRVHGTSNLRTIPDGWRVLKMLLGEYVHRRKAGRSTFIAVEDTLGANVS